MMIGVNPRVSSAKHHHYQQPFRHPRHRGSSEKKKLSSHHVSFLAGMICMLAVVALMYPFQIMSLSKTATVDNAHCGQVVHGSPVSSRLRQSTSTTSSATVNILLLEVHLEGNLGDEMETTPLLEYLQSTKTRQDNPVDITVTAALSGWMEGAERRLSYRSVREHDKLDHILSWEEFQAWSTSSSSNATASPYDIVILAPGPWKLCQVRSNVWNNRPLDVLFGGSVIAETQPTDDTASCTLQTLMQEWSPELVAVRETRSYRKLEPLFNSRKGGMLSMSGDLTHSFQLAPASFDYWKRHYQDPKFSKNNNLHIVFPRANNAKQSITFKSRTIVLETWDNYANATVTLPASDVIFASSSAIEDENVFQDWMYQYYTRFQAHQFVICNTVEQLFGLIANAHHVYTDRYHPGVAAHRLGIDFSIMRYEEERDKLIGLRDLVYKDALSATAIREEHNAKAFAKLGAIIDKAALKKIKRKAK